MFMNFNINNYVYVKLTDFGRKLLQREHLELRIPFPFKLPEEDQNGWSRWQMHDLMNKLGKHCWNGCQIPFETIIRIEMGEDG